MRKMLIRWLVITFALIAAIILVPGIKVDENAWLVVVAGAIILGLVNAILRPILKLLSCGCIVLTLGFFLLILNALALWISSWIAVNIFGIGFYVENFWSALWAGLCVSVVSYLMSLLVYKR